MQQAEARIPAMIAPASPNLINLLPSWNVGSLEGFSIRFSIMALLPFLHQGNKEFRRKLHGFLKTEQFPRFRRQFLPVDSGIEVFQKDHFPAQAVGGATGGLLPVNPQQKFG